jgi:outer membrane murein-binding lipoprotein Lpp
MDLDFLRRQWEAFVSAPAASLIFLAFGAVGAWWFRGSVDSGEIKGLKAQVEGLREQIKTFEQRLNLAHEQEQAASKATQAAKESITVVQDQINRKAPLKDIAATTSSAETHIIEIGKAQERVTEILKMSGLRIVTSPGGIMAVVKNH